MRTQMTLFALIVGLALGASASAQPLDFATFVARAAEGSSAAQAATRGVELARADRERTLSRVLPRLDVTASLTRNDREIAIDLPIAGAGLDAPIVQQQRILRVGAEVRSVLVDGAFFALHRAAGLAVDGAEADAAAAEQAARRAAVELFATWQSLQARRAVAVAAIDTLEAHRAQVEALLEAGAATELDLEQAELARLDTELARLELDAVLSDVERGAAALIGTSDRVELTGELPDAVGAPSWAARDAAAARLAAAEARLRGLRLEVLPRVVASGQASFADAEAIDGERHAWQLTLAVQWSAYAGQSRHAAVTTGRAQRDLALIAHSEATRDAARVEADDAEAIELAQQTSVVAARRAETAAAAAAIARRALSAGAIAPPEALDAELRALDARADAAVAAVAVRRAEWLATLR